MTLAPEGRPQMIASTVVLGAAGWAAYLWFPPVAAIPAVVWLWSIAFFRDPRRVTDVGPNILCSPADGTIADITQLPDHELIGGPAVRIGIFLSLFNVHINRAPCSGVVRSTQYCKGKFLAAMNPRAGELNESNTIVLDPADDTVPGPVVVRQIAGVAARRIVCHASPGTRLVAGERFGLIKFGSRTELIVPATDDTRVLVNIGDKVMAGVTHFVQQPMMRTEGTPNAAHHQDATQPASSPA